MNLSKHIIYIKFFSFILFSNITFGQVSFESLRNEVYVDIIPDKNLKATFESGTQSYDLDVNLDGTIDLTIHARYNHGGTYTHAAVDVQSKNSNIKLLKHHTDSLYINYTSYWSKTNVLMMYDKNDTIMNMEKVNNASFAFSMTNFGQNYGNLNWLGQEDKFFGFEITDSLGQIKFGWVKVDIISLIEANIKSFGIAVPLNTSVVEKSKNELLRVYPNPSSESFNLDLSNFRNSTSILRIFNLSGSLVEEININSTKDLVEFGGQLTEGIYFLEIRLIDRIERIRLIKTN